jgi:hypothetical protein
VLNPKELKKLAAACRSAGISYYKCADFEFILSDSVSPIKVPGKKSVLPTGPLSEPEKLDDDQPLTEEQLLFWSSGGLNENQ